MNAKVLNSLQALIKGIFLPLNAIQEEALPTKTLPSIRKVVREEL